MKTLMISLDKKILDSSSASAKRMIGYGRDERLVIIVPASAHGHVALSQNVTVYSSGGFSRFWQYWQAYKTALNLMKKESFDRITTQDPFFAGLIGARIKAKQKIFLQVQCHGDFFGSVYYRRGSIANRLRYLLARIYVLRQADQFRVVSERIHQSLLGLGIKEEKIKVRPIAVDTELIKTYVPHFDLHARYPGYEKIFLVLGRLDPVKNLPWLIATFAQVVEKHPSYLLVIVGSGKDRKNIEKRVKKYKLAHAVRLEEWSRHPIAYIKTADALLFPSISEGYGLVVVEAVAAGTPVVMNDVGVANYEVKPGDRIDIIPINNRDKWLKAIERI